MFGAITSLARSTLHTRCKFITSFASRSHLRYLTSESHSTEGPADKTWSTMIEENIKVKEAYEGEEGSPDERWQRNSDMALQQLDLVPPATTYSGRSVPVKGGNVADAYGRLQSILQRNKVQAQLRLTERHEKKGVKRRRLSSERWRRQFAHEVRSKVQLVAKIRNRGA